MDRSVKLLLFGILLVLAGTFFALTAFWLGLSGTETYLSVYYAVGLLFVVVGLVCGILGLVRS